MRAFFIGIAVAAIGWETGGLAAEPPLAARSVQLISMGATSPQRPLRAGEDVEDEAPQAADHAALPALPPAFRIHDLSRRWVEFQMADSFSAAPKVPARTDEGDAFAYASVAQPSVLPFTGLRSEEHTSELQSLMRISYAVFCLKNKNIHNLQITTTDIPLTM